MWGKNKPREDDMGRSILSEFEEIRRQNAELAQELKQMKEQRTVDEESTKEPVSVVEMGNPQQQQMPQMIEFVAAIHYQLDEIIKILKAEPEEELEVPRPKKKGRPKKDEPNVEEYDEIEDYDKA